MQKVENYSGQLIRLCQMKLDGHRRQIFIEDGRIRTVSRGKGLDDWSKLCEIPHIADPIASLPDNTVLDGELHCPGKASTEVPRLIKERSPLLRYTVFRTIRLDGEDLPGRVTSQLTLSFHGVEHIDDEWYVEDGVRPSIPHLEASAARRGIEGYVLCTDYQGERYRVKPVRTVDCLVVGVQRGSGKYTGLLGSLFIALRDPHTKRLMDAGKVGTGFSDEDRLSLDWVGKVVEVSYDSITPYGALRFPRFVRVRDDKTPYDID